MTATFVVKPEPDNAGVGIELGLQNGKWTVLCLPQACAAH